jgi:hypothetical protein
VKAKEMMGRNARRSDGGTPSKRGATETLMLAHGFTHRMLVGLVPYGPRDVAPHDCKSRRQND